MNLPVHPACLTVLVPSTTVAFVEAGLQLDLDLELLTCWLVKVLLTGWTNHSFDLIPLKRTYDDSIARESPRLVEDMFLIKLMGVVIVLCKH